MLTPQNTLIICKVTELLTQISQLPLPAAPAPVGPLRSPKLPPRAELLPYGIAKVLPGDDSIEECEGEVMAGCFRNS